ncbi:uncharacterized protein M437DRAFT_69920 [Aureobasidium melanogenum CBS 110374]|uniref:BZIP domain-containing protein n=1 Tax=Aureobasidium melanogenum (strain CBS 110374) TaxID=1043003 RepID=A0A074VHP6_AURM1|nr:uncharacterized protein M437DRAFT_69920 [Aureobasidium melanogenum CBS 110374]KEQ58579.1 hypothetical protein M437DRAFT_69920 [Aureobasidium melanogenum CBS 110374]
MSNHTTYRDAKLVTDMELTLTSTLGYNDSIDTTLPFSLTTMDNFPSIETGFSSMHHIGELGTVSNTFLPSPNSIPESLPNPLSSTKAFLTSPDPWTKQDTCRTTDSIVSQKTQQVSEFRTRGRPRKDLSKKETTQPPSDNINKYRAKNRRASARCREKERSQAAALEEAFQEQNRRNIALKQTTAALREELFCLQMQALQHGDCCCNDVQGYNQRRAQDIAVAWDL